MPTIPAVLAVAGLVGGGISAYGAMQEGKQTNQANQFNAGVAQQEADIARQSGVLNEYRQRKTQYQDIGAMNAKYGKSGVSINTGSPLDAIADSIANSELDIAIGKYNTETSAKLKESEAAQLRKYGVQAERAGYMKAGSTLLTSIADTGFKLSKEKVGA